MPDGALLRLFPDVSRLGSDSRKVAEIFLESAKVATVPGIVLVNMARDIFGFAFPLRWRTIEDGLEIDAIQSLKVFRDACRKAGAVTRRIKTSR